jgi:hypothetical protein
MKGIQRLVLRARRQAGHVSRQQLLERDFRRSSIARAVKSRLLFRVHEGVYRVAGAPDTTEGRLWAAVLWAGDGAVLSHKTAAWWVWSLDGLGRRRPGAVDLTSWRSC